VEQLLTTSNCEQTFRKTLQHLHLLQPAPEQEWCCKEVLGRRCTFRTLDQTVLPQRLTRWQRGQSRFTHA